MDFLNKNNITFIYLFVDIVIRKIDVPDNNSILFYCFSSQKTRSVYYLNMVRNKREFFKRV